MNAMAERWNKAAVVRTKGGPFEMETIHLEEPRQDEVLIRIVATGICHTDAHVRDPASAVPVPAVLGREGAGVVERLGSRVPCRENVFQLPEMTMKAAAQLVEEHALTLRESLQGSMRTCLLALLCLLLCSCTHTEARNTDTKDVTLWYEAFNTKDPVLIDRILSENWVDIPAAPGQPTGREGAKHLLVELTTTFPDLKVTIEEILQDGNKVIVRSEITGTQSKTFMGFPAKNRTMTIMAIDIHEFKDGKIVRTWHTEDWLTGLHQLGVFEK